LHFNLFRRRVSVWTMQDENFLDIGLRLHNVATLSAIKIYIPAQITEQNIEDLGEVLQDRTTLMALFNEAYAPTGQQGARSFNIVDANGNTLMCCHRVQAGTDFIVTALLVDGNAHGTIISFREAFCERLSRNFDNYIRFRVNLNDAGMLNFATSE